MWFDVAVYSSLTMGIVEGLAEGFKNAHNIRQIQPAILLEHIIQCAPLDVFHGNIAHIVFYADIVDSDNARVTQVGCEGSFALETFDKHVIYAKLWGQYF